MNEAQIKATVDQWTGPVIPAALIWLADGLAQTINRGAGGNWWVTVEAELAARTYRLCTPVQISDLARRVACALMN